MIEWLPETGDNLLAAKFSWTLTEEDYEKFSPEMTKRVLAGGTKRIFGDWTELQGWDPGAAQRAFWLRWKGRIQEQRTLHDLIDRMAIIAEPKWQSEVDAIAEILKFPEVRRFDASERDAALAWLREGRS